MCSNPEHNTTVLWLKCKGGIATFLTAWSIFHRAPSRACFFSAVRKMPHKKGGANYKNNLLIDIIDKILPNGKLGWEVFLLPTREDQMRVLDEKSE
jgi:hypothetical protein